MPDPRDAPRDAPDRRPVTLAGMALTNADTIADVIAAYRDNAGYGRGAGDTAMGENFIEPCRHILVLRPKRVDFDGAEVELDLGLIAAEKDQASSWLASQLGVENGGAGEVLRCARSPAMVRCPASKNT
ncbi:MAG: hypothetical protein V3W34_08455 [Phycisphaerae bacterium]